MQFLKEKKEISAADAGYSNFAFISYSRKDAQWAQWLQKRLESYRLPTVLRKGHKHIPQKLSPIFLDETDLNGTVLEDSLQRALADSKFLIVICSPNSVASAWVEQEVQFFIDRGRADYIIPFVVDGEPYAKDTDREAFPAPLRQLEKARLGVSVAQYGKQKAFLWVVATMLDLQFDQLVMRERRRQLRNGIVAGVAAVSTAAALAAGIWYNIPHAKYYESFILEKEVPVGILELASSERAGRNLCYKITTKQGRVISLESVNNEDMPAAWAVDGGLLTYPVNEYSYDEDGQLLSVVEKSESGQLMTKKLLTHDEETNRIAVDYRTPGNQLQATGLSSASSIWNKTEITRELNTYNDRGLLQQVLYQRDSLGTPACDDNGVYGERYEYNQLGQVVRKVNLNAQGQPHNCKYGWAELRYTYDENHRLIQCCAYDSSGEPAELNWGGHGYRIRYDERGNALEQEYFLIDGSLCNNGDGYAREVAAYNEAGDLLSSALFDAEGNPCCHSETKVHLITYEYGQGGYTSVYRFYDTQGNPTIHREYLAFRVDFQYELQQHKVCMAFYDLEEQPTLGQYGAHKIQMHYDAQGHQTDWYYYGVDGEPLLIGDGYASTHNIYDSTGNCERVEYRDREGELIRISHNAAVQLYTYDALGNLSSVRYLDQQEQPCTAAYGQGEIRYSYENGQITSERLYDTQGNPTMGADYYHEVRYEYDQRGNLIRLSYYDMEGELVLLPDDYAVKEMEYDQYGSCLVTRWLDMDLQPTDAPDNCETRNTFDDRGNLIRQEYRTVGVKTLSCYAVEYTYDSMRRVVETRYYDESNVLVTDGESIVRYTYDVRGNLLTCLVLDDNGVPLQSDGEVRTNYEEYAYDAAGYRTSIKEYMLDEQGQALFRGHIVDTYDAYGRVVRSDILDEEGNPMNNENGVCTVLRAYDSLGYEISVRYYAADGSIAVNGYGVHGGETDYDAAGNALEIRWYGADGLPYTENGSHSMERRTYDHLGNLTSITYYDDRGDYYKPDASDWVKVVYVNDSFGYTIEAQYYDEAEQLIGAMEYMPGIAEVLPGYMAEELGVPTEVIILQLDDWNYYDQTPELRSHGIHTQLRAVRNREKTLVVYDMDTGRIEKFTFPAGNMGIRLVSAKYQKGTMEAIRPQYEAWLKSQ